MSSAGNSSGHGGRGGGLATNRLEALVDGVFAVVMTLLVLDITVPSPTQPHAVAHLVRNLIALKPTVLSYALSFVIAGIYWVGHHNQFAYIRRTDRPLLWINILFLMCVAFIPFSACTTTSPRRLRPRARAYLRIQGDAIAAGARSDGASMHRAKETQ